MVENMKYINIMGSCKDIDRVIEKYISNYNIQLEYTERELADSKDLKPCMSENIYIKALAQAKTFADMTGNDITPVGDISSENALKTIENIAGFYSERDDNLKELEKQKELIEEIIGKIKPFIQLDFDVSSLQNFQYIKYRFGRMPLSDFKQTEKYIYDRSEILFIESMRDSKFIYFVYFVPSSLKDKADTMFSSLHFVRTIFPYDFSGKELKGTPLEIYQAMEKELLDTETKISSLRAESLFALGMNKQDIVDSYFKIKQLHDNYELRKYAARTQNDFFIFVGWMTESEAEKLETEISGDKKALFIIEEQNESEKVPTKLKNIKLFRPFEFFVRTYGLPKYGEIDPTPFVAVTYMLLFGLMFGDLGQGAVISLLGFYLYKRKGLDLGAIMGIIGISSMVFGLLYGSVFGLEELIPALWMRPAENINTILLLSVLLGVILILTAMIFNLVNAYHHNDMGRLLFGPNGVAGLVFYTAVVIIALSFFTGRNTVAFWMIFIFIIIPLLIIAFREPIEKALYHHTKAVQGSRPLFLLETFIELFEVILTYFTNTVSFVRVGAFALSHAGMMSVVMLMAKNINGTHNLAVLILGNILVMAMEGLVVGIQVLRIEFYELFSRYYEGGGHGFESRSLHEK